MVMQRVPLNSNFKGQQKRKFEEYIYDGVFPTSFELIHREKYDSKNSKDPIDSSSPLASSTLSHKNENVLEGTKDGEYCGICMEDYSHFSDSKDSTKGLSYPMYLGNLEVQPRDLLPSSSFSFTTKTLVNVKSKRKHLEVLKSFGDDNKTLPFSLSSTENDIDRVSSINKFLPSRSSHLSRLIIPIGPRFQAEVPKWEGGTDLKHFNGYDDLKWLGTPI
ncbi:uncharacterized protein LOC131611908 [Vicia villosa]|uniref:uncharacterized protein LOC131611908 n=1 Tax=Vicia villosa TaxID=3911 RepID=UPI00273B0BCD|nr:uncharacterized protein LOC131611908 [Vicia villosa]